MEHKDLFLLLPDFIIIQNKMLIHTFVEMSKEVRSRQPFL